MRSEYARGMALSMETELNFIENRAGLCDIDTSCRIYFQFNVDKRINRYTVLILTPMNDFHVNLSQLILKIDQPFVA